MLEVNDQNGQRVQVQDLTRDHFRQAAELLERTHLSRGVYISEHGCGFCTVGAFMQVTGLPIEKHDEVEDYPAFQVFIHSTLWIDYNARNPLILEFIEGLPGVIMKREMRINEIFSWSDHSSQEAVTKTLRAFAAKENDVTSK
jgi:hypothetical protein